MKKLFYLSILTILINSCNKPKVSVTGTITNVTSTYVYLEKMFAQNQTIIDSAKVDKNQFAFSNLNIKEGIYKIRCNNNQNAFFVIEQSKQPYITGDATNLLETYQVENSPESSVLVKFTSIIVSHQKEMSALTAILQNGASGKIKMSNIQLDSVAKSLEKPYNEIVQRLTSTLKDEISKNSNKLASIVAVQQLPYEQFTELYKKVAEDIKANFADNEDAIGFYEKVFKSSEAKAQTHKLQIGDKMADITLPDVNGKIVSLSNLKGKYVLVDFWATWCGPCRKELPNVKKCYDAFKNKGFEVFGVSLDKSADDWKNYIKEKELNWIQVSDLKHWKSVVVAQFGIESIPFTVLLDKEGKIIAIDLRGDELYNTIKGQLN